MARKPVRPWHRRPKAGSPQDPRTWDNYYKVDQRSHVTGIEIANYHEAWREDKHEPVGLVAKFYRLAPAAADRRTRQIYGNITPSSMGRLLDLSWRYSFSRLDSPRKKTRLWINRTLRDHEAWLVKSQEQRDAQRAYWEQLRKEDGI